MHRSHQAPALRSPSPPMAEHQNISEISRKLGDRRGEDLAFLLPMSIAHACAGMRRETVVDGSSAARRTELAALVRVMAEKRSHVALISPLLTDEVKKRVLTTFLALMNLQESLDRSITRNRPGPQSIKPAAGRPLTTLAIAHG